MNRLPHTQSRVRIVVLALFAVVALIRPSAIASAQPDTGRLATTTELRQMRDDGQYRICLQQIGRVLRSGNVNKAYDRFDLLLLRGDCLLRLEDPETAQAAYTAAARSPVAAQAREGRATALLIRRSLKMTYVTRGGEGAGAAISIATPDGRTQALRALLQDELRARDASFKKAISAQNLVPIQDVLPSLTDVYAVERTATDGDTQTRPILEAIAQRARTLIDQELVVRDQQITDVQSLANQRVDYGGGFWWSGDARRGLRTTDRRTLRDLINYLHRIEETARLGQQLAATFDADGTVWDALISRASKETRAAQDVLDAE